MQQLDNIKDKLFNTSIEIRLTYRFYYYIIYLLVIGSLISNAIMGYYEDKLFAVILWIGFVVSYIWSLFLIRSKEVK